MQVVTNRTFNFLPVHAGLYRSYRESRNLPSAWGWHLAIRREAYANYTGRGTSYCGQRTYG